MKRFDPSLYLVTDERPFDDALKLVREAVHGGVTMVQLRRKDRPMEETKALGLSLRKVLAPLKIPLLVNDYTWLAKEIGAQGVHLGQTDMKPSEARKIVGPDAIIGLSIEAPDQLAGPEPSFADYLAVSPVFATLTKANTAPPLLLEGVRTIRKAWRLPLIAIGGINGENVREVLRAGADGVAVVSAICASPDPSRAARKLRDEIDRAKFPRLLTIAGSDSGGGAGIQADLKTFQALGGYGMSVVTALTAQNTKGVRSIFPVSASFVAEQIEEVMSDIGVDAIKIGMLFSAEIMEAVATTLKKYPETQIVCDPVMVAKGGSPLLQPQAVESLKRALLPLATLITPNVPEAEILSGESIHDENGMERAADTLLENCQCLLLKGGHLSMRGVVRDLIATKSERVWLENDRVESANTHGTGCTFSAAIAASLAKGRPLIQAIREARHYLQGAILAAANRRLGSGHGPLDHGWNLRREG